MSLEKKLDFIKPHQIAAQSLGSYDERAFNNYPNLLCNKTLTINGLQTKVKSSNSKPSKKNERNYEVNALDLRLHNSIIRVEDYDIFFHHNSHQITDKIPPQILLSKLYNKIPTEHSIWVYFFNKTEAIYPISNVDNEYLSPEYGFIGSINYVWYNTLFIENSKKLDNSEKRPLEIPVTLREFIYIDDRDCLEVINNELIPAVKVHLEKWFNFNLDEYEDKITVNYVTIKMDSDFKKLFKQGKLTSDRDEVLNLVKNL